MKTIEERVRSIEGFIETFDRLNTQRASDAIRNDARRMALESLVEELAVKFGLSRGDFYANLNERATILHDRILSRIEDGKPRRAAELDQRKLDEIPDSEEFPPLF